VLRLVDGGEGWLWRDCRGCGFETRLVLKINWTHFPRNFFDLTVHSGVVCIFRL